MLFEIIKTAFVAHTTTALIYAIIVIYLNKKFEKKGVQHATITDFNSSLRTITISVNYNSNYGFDFRPTYYKKK